MSRPAAFLGDYVDCRFLPGLKLARISIEIPIEEANAFLSAFGAPDKASPVKVAIARLVDAPSGATENGPQDAGNTAPVKPHADPVKFEDSRRTFSSLPRSQQAALKCRDQDFQEWLGFKRSEIARQFPNEDAAECARSHTDSFLKQELNIVSKTDLDRRPEAGANWDKLLTDFSVRGIVR